MLEHLPDLEEALKCFKDPIVLGEINVDLHESRSLRIHQVANFPVEYSLIDLVNHFRQRCWFRNLKTWYPDLVPSTAQNRPLIDMRLHSWNGPTPL